MRGRMKWESRKRWRHRGSITVLGQKWRKMGVGRSKGKTKAVGVRRKISDYGLVYLHFGIVHTLLPQPRTGNKCLHSTKTMVEKRADELIPRRTTDFFFRWQLASNQLSASFWLFRCVLLLRLETWDYGMLRHCCVDYDFNNLTNFGHNTRTVSMAR